jgi:hypothetical protein
MNLEDITVTGINPALALLPPSMDSPAARVMLLTICGQEADCRHRVQVIAGGARGPAHGLLQFEKGGGVRGVMEHAASKAFAKSMCDRLGIAFDRETIWNAIEYQDALAFGFGRLLLFTDAKPLPVIADPAGAWAYYLRNWRPGKPHPEEWPAHHAAAVEYVTKVAEAAA